MTLNASLKNKMFQSENDYGEDDTINAELIGLVR